MLCVLLAPHRLWRTRLFGAVFCYRTQEISSSLLPARQPTRFRKTVTAGLKLEIELRELYRDGRKKRCKQMEHSVVVGKQCPPRRMTLT